MGISGQYVNKFSEANLAVVSDISMNSDYPHFWFDVVSTDGKTVTLKDRGIQLTLTIHKTNPKARKHPIFKNAQVMEYVVIDQSSTFERLYKRPPQKFKVMAFQGRRL
jgi:hypothetical protein